MTATSTTRADSGSGLGPLLWLTAVVFFGLGDLATTSIGLSTPAVEEAGPVVRFLVGRYGIASVVLLKSVAFLLAVLLWRAVPDPYDVGVPLGLSLLGAAATAWNVLVLASP